jgi:cytochrome c553
MTRKLILLFALSVAAVTVGISTYAQQPPTGTPTDLVAMTEPPIPAPAGFNNKTNGFTDQDEFDKDREAFEDVETIVPEEKSSASRSQTASNSDETQTKGGLGPVYNATSCVSCHQNPITGSSSQVSELEGVRILAILTATLLSRQVGP